MSPSNFLLLLVFHLPGALLAEPSKQTKDSTQDTSSFKYAAIVDCGSSGSRAHLFRWPADAENDRLLSTVEPMIDPSTGKRLVMRIQPGLSSIANNPEQASDYMRPLMDFISAHVPQEAQPETPIYFLGTAGLRLLSHEKQQQILEDIMRDLKLEYRFSILKGSIIRGDQEGIFQWLSVNANADRLTENYDLSGDLHCKAPTTRRYGMIEMGGASTQISFELTPQTDLIIRSRLKASRLASTEYTDSQLNIQLSSNRTVRLLSTTFLGFGSNSARELAVDLLVRDALRYNPHHLPISLDDPCLPYGAEESMKKPVQMLMQSRSAEPQWSWQTADQRTPGRMFTVRLVGRGNYYACQRLLNRMIKLAKFEQLNCGLPPDDGQKNLFHLRQYDDRSRCPMWLIGTSFVPFGLIQFVGLSELFYSTNEILDASGRYNPWLVRTRINQVCATPYQVLLQRFPQANLVDTKRVLHECFKATWLFTFLHVGLRMPFNLGLLETVGKINGNEIDWTLGAMFASLFSSH